MQLTRSIVICGKVSSKTKESCGKKRKRTNENNKLFEFASSSVGTSTKLSPQKCTNLIEEVSSFLRT